MKRLGKAHACALAAVAVLTWGAVGDARAAEVRDVNSLGSTSGGYTFGYASNGNKSLGPFMVDTASGRMWVYKRMEKKNWRLVPVEYVGDDGAHGHLPGTVPVVEAVVEPEASPGLGEATAAGN